MDAWRLDPLAARVVAWHNRHPLARRITPKHVHSPGFVALPFVHPLAASADEATATPPPASDDGHAAGPAESAVASTAPAAGAEAAAGSLRERVLALSAQPSDADAAAPSAAEAPPPADAGADRQHDPALKAAFSEDFIAPLSPTRVARWALRHARESASEPAGGPLRRVAPDGSRLPPGSRVVMRYAMTAAVEAGGARSRVLVGPAASAPVLGRRLWSRPRVAGAGAGLLGALSLLLAAVMPQAGPPADVERALALAARAASAPVPPPAIAAAASSALAVAGSASPALRVDDDWPASQRPGPIGPPPAPRAGLSPQAAAQGEQSASAPAAVPDPGPVPVPATAAPKLADRSPAPAASAVAAGPSASAAAVAVGVPGDAFWALSSRLLRTRTESQQMMEAVDALLREQGRESVHVEMLPMGEDWHVVGWPFKTRADADRARAGLLARGLHVEVIDF